MRGRVHSFRRFGTLSARMSTLDLRMRSCSRPDSNQTWSPLVIENAVTGMCLARLLARNIRTDSRRRAGGLPCNCQFHASVTAEPETRSSHSIDETIGCQKSGVTL